MAITVKSEDSSNLDVLHATKVSFRGIGWNLDVFNVPISELRRLWPLDEGLNLSFITRTVS